MYARKKLNVAYLTGSLLTAGIFGAVAESWLVFVITLILTMAFQVYQGDIRSGKEPIHRS